MSAKYLVDSNFWITCENELYPRRHFPSFIALVMKISSKPLHHIGLVVLSVLLSSLNCERFRSWMAPLNKNHS